MKKIITINDNWQTMISYDSQWYNEKMDSCKQVAAVSTDDNIIII